VDFGVGHCLHERTKSHYYVGRRIQNRIGKEYEFLELESPQYYYLCMLFDYLCIFPIWASVNNEARVVPISNLRLETSFVTPFVVK